MKAQYKIGLDIHGVIDKYPGEFSFITKELKDLGYEIHILTGHLPDDEIKQELKKYNIVYDKLFSILGHHRKLNSKMWQDDRGWWIDDLLWNKTKGEYCLEQGINFHLDDSPVYGNYFSTPYGQLVYTNIFYEGKLEKNIIKTFTNNGFIFRTR